MKSLTGLLLLEAQGKEGYAIHYVLERKGWDKTQWLLHMQEEMPKEEEEQLKRI